MDKETKERFKGLKKALKLQAKEYERRLEDLNGEGKRIKKILKDSIPREVFDRTMTQKDEKFASTVNEFEKKIDEIVDKQIRPIAEWKTKQEGSMNVIKWLIGIAVAILIGIAIKLLSS